MTFDDVELSPWLDCDEEADVDDCEDDCGDGSGANPSEGSAVCFVLCLLFDLESSPSSVLWSLVVCVFLRLLFFLSDVSASSLFLSLSLSLLLFFFSFSLPPLLGEWLCLLWVRPEFVPMMYVSGSSLGMGDEILCVFEWVFVVEDVCFSVSSVLSVLVAVFFSFFEDFVFFVDESPFLLTFSSSDGGVDGLVSVVVSLSIFLLFICILSHSLGLLC